MAQGDTDQTGIGFFSSFNARHLGAEEVAKSFVPHAKFRQLAALQNSLLVGPRGSGKTHLLKMLQPKALGAWDHSEADEMRQAVQYWGVFVPADEAWRQQIESTASCLPLETQGRFRSAIFTAHVQRSVVDCFLQLTHDRPSNDRGYAKVLLTPSKESDLSKSLAASWALKPRIHSLLGIRQSIVDRCAQLYESSDSPSEATSLLENCQTQAVQAALQAISAFDATIGRFDGRWCLLFDEIEIAPPEVQQVLFRSLRSSDQHLLFKVALSPSTQAAKVFRESTGPSAGNDFDEISLYSEPREAAMFCERLWDNLTQGTTARGLAPVAVLGHSLFHEPDTAAPYGKDGRWQASSSSLAKKDPSYKKFLDHYNIDPDSLATAPRKLKDSVIRKIGPIVGFRDFMMKWDHRRGHAVPRGDKSRPAQLFSGWEVLCLVSEGNPRWFTGIAKALLIKRDASPSRRELSRETQYSALAAASRKFLDYVATIPTTGRSSFDGPETGLKNLLNLLAGRIRAEIMVNDFSLDPALSFQVDETISEDVLQAIFDGLYSGALIPIGDVERQFAFSLDLSGQRLRPTYLIAPLELLPLRTGKSRKLSSLIEAGSSVKLKGASRWRLVTSSAVALGSQERLFNE